MNRVAKRAKYLSILIAFFIFCGAIFFNDYRMNASTWVVHPSNKNIYNNGELTVAGTVYSSDGVKLLQSDSTGLHYADDALIRKATLHVIGDKGNNITTGVLSSQKDKLIGYDILNGVYGANNSNNNINLTINAELSAVAYDALGNHNGAVGIYNYETGEILCMVSKVSYDPHNTPDLSQDIYDGVYINRVMNGLYVPGSIMKLVTAQAAIETISDIHSQTFYCNHGTEVNGEWINCTGTHGTQTFEEALANSCNAAFAEISLQLGESTLQEYASKAGITSSYTINGVKTSAGKFDVTNAAQVNLAWAGIGQYTTMVNPMQYMMYVGAIANGGTSVNPYYIDSSNFISSTIDSMMDNGTQVVDSSTAEQLTSLMRNNTVSNYGDYNFPDLELCAKTGTAEVEDGAPHSWFVGFSDNPSTPIAFAIIVENGDGLTALSTSKTILNQAASIYTK
ncbi:MAG: penicillin-binding transpeptidase domain-containing protein [Coprobacillaceae bacterium]